MTRSADSGPGPQTQLSIGQVAERTGLSVHALRFYERQGLLAAPVRRTVAGRRIYTDADMEWLRICTRLRASGMPLTAIQRFTALVRQGPGNEGERLALLREHQQRVQAQVAALNDCLDVIAWKVDVYEEHLQRGTAEALWTGTPPLEVR